MTTFLLIRHASHDLLGRSLAGRAPGVHLSERGVFEAQALAERLATTPIAAIYTSPRERARETAAPLAARLGTEARVDEALDEIDFGGWSGRSFAALESEAGWSMWVERRSVAQPPGGESIVTVQKRVAGALERLQRVHEHDTIALISHGDVIKAALAHVLRGSLDELERFDIAPASVSAIAAGASWSQVKLVNASSYP